MEWVLGLNWTLAVPWARLGAALFSELTSTHCICVCVSVQYSCFDTWTWTLEPNKRESENCMTLFWVNNFVFIPLYMQWLSFCVFNSQSSWDWLFDFQGWGPRGRFLERFLSCWTSQIAGRLPSFLDCWTSQIPTFPHPGSVFKLLDKSNSVSTCCTCRILASNVLLVSDTLSMSSSPSSSLYCTNHCLHFSQLPPYDTHHPLQHGHDHQNIPISELRYFENSPLYCSCTYLKYPINLMLSFLDFCVKIFWIKRALLVLAIWRLQ